MKTTIFCCLLLLCVSVSAQILTDNCGIETSVDSIYLNNTSLNREDGSIGGQVCDSLTTMPVSNATITSGSFTTQTDVGGYYVLTIPSGNNYSLTCSKAGYYSQTVDGIDMPDGGMLFHNFYICPLPGDVGEVGGVVTEVSTGLTIDGATVVIGSISTGSDSLGIYCFTDLPVGLYPMMCLANGYHNSYWDNVTVMPDVAVTIDFVMQPLVAIDDLPLAIEELLISPNPFNPSTSISFSLEQSQLVEASIYNTIGQKVYQLHKGYLPSGNHIFTWTGVADSGSAVSSGIYFVQIKTRTRTVIKKAALLK
ncbi:MAG: carboxypeptidase regulatory-like domain-containing protein [Candidatus Cloacimonetes bacterium]|nr:carboxypeptidase regulatory-like domain-containing protein [Candidatus Cloacimonadota bacterium]